MDELRVFVCERLHAITTQILGAIEKTINNYEEQTTRLKEENDRQRALLDNVLKAKIPRIKEDDELCHRRYLDMSEWEKHGSDHGTKNTSAVYANPHISNSSPACGARDALNHSSDFLKFAERGDCPYCLNRTQATETHLIKKHFLCAVRFAEDGTEKFVVPCTCKDRIQNRSHWHCPNCRKIIFRKCNFEVHLSKQHKYTILQESQDTVSHQELQNSKQLQSKVERIEGDRSEIKEQSLETDHAPYSACVGLWDEGRPLSSSPPPLETQLGDRVGGIFQPAGEYQHTIEVELEEWKKNHTAPTLKARCSKKKKPVKRSLPVLTLNQKKSQLSVSQNPTGPHCCKVCGKTFHYMYTLRTHARVHAVDKIQICGFCGKHLELTESLVQHLQNHKMKSKCGKQFSNDSCLKQHMRFHRPKVLNVTSLKKTQMGETL
ncbi:Zinc finger protein 57 [Larimichthys crocea]|uniref:Uncharacterized protein n=1 Tax=Larimichthys crocea TaxID=215358 RepID=A0ACD3RG71_LARCR|nr:Zinc finger protein 57 [Larimichthys crocea]